MSYQTIEVQQVESLIQQGPITILDVRDLNSYNQEHMENAVPANDVIVEQLIRKKLREQTVLVYCYLGHSSRDFCSLLGKMGFKSVYSLNGGYTAWKKFQVNNTPAQASELGLWMQSQGFRAAQYNDRIENGNTPLMQAALENKTEFAGEIIKAGADVSLVNNDENNALWFACVGDSVEILQLLADNGIDLNHQNVNGATCLIYAASAGKFEVVKKLIELGADPTIATQDGFNALDSAATLPILKFLKPLCKPVVQNA